MVTLTINNKKVTDADNTTILEAATRNGIAVPHLCKHPKLSTFGGCRLCVVDVKGIARPVASCTTTAAEGIAVTLSTPAIESAGPPVRATRSRRPAEACAYAAANKPAVPKQGSYTLSPGDGDASSAMMRAIE